MNTRCEVPCPCKPDCAGKACGDDGCGGTCGTCGADSACAGGLCSCLFESCGAACCAEAEACEAGSCKAPEAEWISYTDLSGGGVYLWKGQGAALKLGSCGQPWGIEYVPPDAVYVACVASDSVERMTLNGQQTTVYKTSDIFMNPRDVVLGPGGAMYFSSNASMSSTVWKIDEAAKTAAGYAKVGTQENMGIAFSPAGKLFWADLQGDGFVFTVPPGGGPPSTLLTNLGTGYSLRDMELGYDGNLYIVNWFGAGRLKIYTQAGVKVQHVDTPGKAYGVAHAPSGLVYVMMEMDDGSGLVSGIHSWDGSSWAPVLTGIQPVGNLQAFAEP